MIGGFPVCRFDSLGLPLRYQISLSSKFNLVMFKIEPVNLHEQFASDYLRLQKIYLKNKKQKNLTFVWWPIYVFYLFVYLFFYFFYFFKLNFWSLK